VPRVCCGSRAQTGNFERVKLLFDENLSPRLPEVLADVYSGSAHVHDCGLGNADDSAIWQYAKENGFTIVSKDSDFQERSVLLGQPPKLVWLHVANCSTQEIEQLLRSALSTIRQFVEEAEESCLVLGVRVDKQ
jgi:predicted nuclease of predicted toxin-antitoxin system